MPEEIGAASLARLKAQSERQRLAGAVLRDDIRALWIAYPRRKAHEIRSLLTRDYRPLTDDSRPSIRRVQEILRELRAESSASRIDLRLNHADMLGTECVPTETPDSSALLRLGFSLAEAELASSLSRSTLLRKIEAGELVAVKVGARLVIAGDSLAKLCGAKQILRGF